MQMGKWNKTANGYDSYEIIDGEARLIFQLIPLIKQQFGLTPQQTKPLTHIDGVFIKYESFYLDWDVWTGFSVFATSEAGNRIVRQIATYIETRLNECATEHPIS